jgi:hypothetical protein
MHRGWALGEDESSREKFDRTDWVSKYLLEPIPKSQLTYGHDSYAY